MKQLFTQLLDYHLFVQLKFKRHDTKTKGIPHDHILQKSKENIMSVFTCPTHTHTHTHTHAHARTHALIRQCTGVAGPFLGRGGEETKERERKKREDGSRR